MNKIDHITKGLSRIITQYKESENLINYIITLLTEANNIEDVIFQLYEERYLDTATGVQLDVLGQIVGQARFNIEVMGNIRPLTDDEYRYVLRVKIATNENGVTPKEIINNIKTVIRVDTVEYIETGYAGYTISIGKKLTDTEKLILQQGFLPKPLGVGAYYISDFEGDVFGFKEDPQAKSFGTLTNTAIGGVFAELI